MVGIKIRFGKQGKGAALCQPLCGIHGLEPTTNLKLGNPIALHDVTSSNFQHFINLFDCVFCVPLDAHWYGVHFWNNGKNQNTKGILRSGITDSNGEIRESD